LFANTIEVPAERQVRYAATDRLSLLWERQGQPLEVTTARFAFVSDFNRNIQIVDGAQPAVWSGQGPIDVLVGEQEANSLTLLVGDTYRLSSTFASAGGVNLPLRVAGIWRPADPKSTYWFQPPATFSSMLIAPEQSFARALGDPRIARISYATWYSALDTEAVSGEGVPDLLGQIESVSGQLGTTLPGIELERSPTAALERHRAQVRVLTLTLALFSIPLLGVIAYFIAQLAALTVQRQQQEIAVLRSRGSSRAQVLGLALGQGLALGALALAAGLPLGVLIAQLLVWTQSFLFFNPSPGPPVELLASSWRHGLLALLLAIPAITLPSLRASARTIVSFKQERSRTTRPPLWRRLYLDVWLLAPALYGVVQLRRNGLIGIPGIAPSAQDPFRNPLLMLAPALFVLALALVALRLVPLLLAILARLLGRTRGLGLLTLRYLARSAQAYSGPVLLITLTLSLAAYTASMARTLDGHTVARARYSTGADIRLVYSPGLLQGVLQGGAGGEQGGSEDLEALPGNEEGPPQASIEGGFDSGAAGNGIPGDEDPAAVPITEPGEAAEYTTRPVDEYLNIPGVRAATRVAPSTATINVPNGATERGTFLAVDRATLPGVLEESWRADYASESLGAVMNRLALDPSAVLVSGRYAREQGLGSGDRLTLELSDTGEAQTLTFVVVGVIEYFPTLYEQSAPFLIGNLEYSYEGQGAPYPYQVWMNIAPGADLGRIEGEAFGYDLVVLPGTPRALLQADLLRPERQGLFGLLSVGFLAAGLVTIIGYLASTLVGFQRRLVEMGTLRAMGLGTRQLAAMLVSEQMLVVGVGAVVGTGLGVLASRVFVPLLQVRTGQFPDTPTFLVRIAWEQIAILGAVAGVLLALTILITLLLIRRMRIFEAVKLGESV
jgi:putative ABC transport system permease protein